MVYIETLINNLYSIRIFSESMNYWNENSYSFKSKIYYLKKTSDAFRIYFIFRDENLNIIKEYEEFFIKNNI